MGAATERRPGVEATTTRSAVPEEEAGWAHPALPPPRCGRTLRGARGFGPLLGTEDDGTPPKKSPTPEQEAPSESGPRADAEVTSCSVDSTTSWPEAKIRITNHSSRTSDYWVSVEFVDAKGEHVGDTVATADNLASGQVANVPAGGLEEASGQVKCRITDDDRWAS
ncbi:MULTISPECIES: FxLYD domain-containing protein [unclassified Streptomyces]|uniref:FxLYD domain-containing protein n=1 Tax=unclassified Streptomyces TaxID=2593676 RepID=UPI00352F73F1